MRILTYFICLLLSVPMFGQTNLPTTESVEIAENADSVGNVKVYCLILGINKNALGLGNKISVQVDFGEKQSWWGNDGRDILVDENGKDIKFNGMIDAMNFLSKQGWNFENAYAITVNSQNVYHWLMSKTIPADGNAKDGLTQKRDRKK